MAKRIIPHRLNDWSQIAENDGFWGKINLFQPELNFGIHQYNNNLWTSGMVGVGRVFDINENPISDNGAEHVLIISSRYGMNPWDMLECVMQDDEYEDYLRELEKDDKFLFKIFYDQDVIPLEQKMDTQAELLYALSFLNSCYSLCKKGLKKSLIYKNENYTAKLRGKIDVTKNMKFNTARGRCDKFFCKYIDFTENNIENQIIKSALVRCKDLLREKFESNSTIVTRISFCMNVLRKVSKKKISNTDFKMVEINGLYSYYKPVIQQAKAILGQKFHSYVTSEGDNKKKNVYTIPYVINMETLFEFYTRTVLKKILPSDKYCLKQYSHRLFLQKGITKTEDSEKGIHLMHYCIPDLLICDANTEEPIVVLDAKYKPDNKPVRADSHQILSYVLLAGVEKCGFVFPDVETRLKTMKCTNDNFLPINTENVSYYELLLGNIINEEEIKKILE